MCDVCLMCADLPKASKNANCYGLKQTNILYFVSQKCCENLFEYMQKMPSKMYSTHTFYPILIPNNPYEIDLPLDESQNMLMASDLHSG